MSYKKLKVSEFAKIVSGGTPSTKIPHYWDGDISWITPRDLSNYEFTSIACGERNISTEGLNNSSACLLPANTVLLSSRAPVGYVAIAKNPLSTNQGFKNLICKHDIADYLFVYYLLKVNRSLLESHATGSTFKELSASRLSQIEFSLPQLNTQKKVGSILSGYDDLIANNLWRIKLLEQAAMELYKEWFVRLRFPGYQHIRIEKDIPEGWEKKKISEVCQSVGGGTPSTKKKEYWEDGDVMWVIPTDITRNNCLVLLDSEKKITEEGLKHSSAKLLPPDTILMTSRASVGFFGLIDKETSTNQGFISIIPNEDYQRMYLLFNLLSRREEILLKAKGSTYPEINKSTFRNMDVFMPDKALLIDFNELAYTNIKQVRILQKQNQKLHQGRDLLLPKLMNGEIEV